MHDIFYDYHKNMNRSVIWTAPEALAESSTLHNIAIYSIILFIVSAISNSTVTWILLKNKSLLHRANILILTLTIINLIGTLIQLPILIISTFYKKLKLFSLYHLLKFFFHLTQICIWKIWLQFPSVFYVFCWLLFY
jgi:hypothetical protein